MLFWKEFSTFRATLVKNVILIAIVLPLKPTMESASNDFFFPRMGFRQKKFHLVAQIQQRPIVLVGLHDVLSMKTNSLKNFFSLMKKKIQPPMQQAFISSASNMMQMVALKAFIIMTS